MTSICDIGFLNCTEPIGIIIGQATTYTTGSIFLTLLFIMLFLIAVATLFQVRLEYTAIIILPLLFSYMAYYAEFIGIGAVILIYLAILITKNFILK